MADIRTWLIGRNPECDIVLADATISRRHAELVEAADGRFFLTDRESAAGTWTWSNGEWVRLRQGFVTEDEKLLLGRYATTVRALMKLAAKRPAGGAAVAATTPVAVEPDLPAGGVMRNPRTGEIVRKE